MDMSPAIANNWEGCSSTHMKLWPYISAVVGMSRTMLEPWRVGKPGMECTRKMASVLV